MLLVFLVVMALIFWYDWVRIPRYGDRGEKIAFAVLMLIALGLGSAMVMDVSLPNPTKAIEMIFKPFTTTR